MAFLEKFTIGQLAKKGGVTPDTIRYYEKEGLIPTPERNELNNYRLYDEEALLRLRFIRKAKELGFSLKDIQELLALRVEENKNCDDVRALAARKKLEVLTKIKQLQRIANSLDQLIHACERNRSTNSCPILSSIEES